MDEKTREAMLKIIKDKKEKSACQNNRVNKPGNIGNTVGSKIKYRKGGLFDK